MSRAVLSLGSNLGNRLALLDGALHALGALGARFVAVSPVYETDPWGPVAQDDFLNIVAIADAAGAAPRDWLRWAHLLEDAAERVRAQRWGPRTLDVDVVALWDDGRPVLSDDPVLTLPHPQAANRAFVLVPWLAADPDAELPGPGAGADAAPGSPDPAARSVRDLLAALPAADVAGVRLRADLRIVDEIRPRDDA